MGIICNGLADDIGEPANFGDSDVEADQMATIPAGGPSTVNGVLYQMLWSLLRSLKMNVKECSLSAEGNSGERAVLILEPRGGGGDLQERVGDRRVVEQLKAKSDGGTWSLTDVVKDVLPDLYLAYDPALPGTEYRFVTEGGMGRWMEAYSFFKQLSQRNDAIADVLLRLDDAREIKFQRGRPSQGSTEPPYWPLAKYTERSIFERIVQQMRERKAITEREAVEQTRRGVWDLLAHFTFVPGQTTDVVQREVDSLLLALVGRDVDLDEKRDAMIAGLARLATQGSKDIRSDEFLQGYSLDSTPLTEWSPLRERAAASLARDLRRLKYDPTADVRAASTADVLQVWNSSPILVVSAESGAGKSWLLYALAQRLAADEALVILIDATGDGDQDCQRAADAFWKRIKGNDNGLTLDGIAKRRRELVHPCAEAWLTVFIDGVQSSREASQLARLSWEEWNVRVVCSCLPEVARTMKAAAGDRATVYNVPDFTLDELRQYLELRSAGGWGDIPLDVRATLRRPLLARLYCDIVQAGGWMPSSEYELYSRCWGRLLEGEQGDNLLDTMPIHRLALSVLNGGNYPWTVGQLDDARLCSQALGRLCRVGWLQPAPQQRHQIWHDRLLNWAVAEAIRERFDAGEMDLPTVCDILRRLYLAPTKDLARPLGYVPMDVIWLLSDPRRNQADAVAVILEALETAS